MKLKHFFWLICLLLSQSILAQDSYIKGKVSDSSGEPILGVTIYYKTTTIGVTTNNEGDFNIRYIPDQVLVFQYLGYNTKEFIVDENKNWNVTLEASSIHLTEVHLEHTEDPAYPIIRNAIKNRKLNRDKLTDYTADFYSRGLVQMKSDSTAPKRIRKEIEEFSSDYYSQHDTLVLYLSETVSKITSSPPDKFYEEILASKVSGDEIMFSFNSAERSDFSLYYRSISLNNATIISPITSAALQHYTYKLVGEFYDNNQLIYKIEISPKRNDSPSWIGDLYIVDDTWEIYGSDIYVPGSKLHMPMLDGLQIKQNYIWTPNPGIWTKSLQETYFEGGLFKVNFGGRFIAHYSNYDFKELTHKFGKEKMRIVADAIKTDVFWDTARPVPLTQIERGDYKFNDSIIEIKTSKVYLDSIDNISNRFKVPEIITGYRYKNSHKNWSLSYGGLESPHYYNTIQGFSLGTSLNYSKYHNKEGTKHTGIKGSVEYGTSDHRWRPKINYTHRFNAINHARLSVFAGKELTHFNRNEPISRLLNTAYTVLSNRNYMKAYDLSRVGASYGQEIVNGIYFSSNIAWERRSPLYNTKLRDKYAHKLTSNNPLDPDNETTTAFDTHKMIRAAIGFSFRFGQTYFSHPDRKIIDSYKGPRLSVNAIFGVSPDESDHNFIHARINLSQDVKAGLYGTSSYNFTAGKFFNTKDTQYTDYQHFTGNRTIIGHNDFNSFELLPYYALSTNKSYIEGHWEHNFQGAITRSLPLIRSLGWNLIVGGDLLITENNKPYTEWHAGFDNIGFGKWRILRVDYVQSNFNYKTEHGVRLRLGI